MAQILHRKHGNALPTKFAPAGSAANTVSTALSIPCYHKRCIGRSVKANCPYGNSGFDGTLDTVIPQYAYPQQRQSGIKKRRAVSARLKSHVPIAEAYASA